MVDADDLTLEEWKRVCDEYEEENKKLKAEIEQILNDDDYRREAVSEEVCDSLSWHEERVAVLNLENAKLLRELQASVEMCHALRKQIESDDR